MEEIEAVRQFLASPQGKAHTHRALSRCKLSASLEDDLVQEVLRRCASRISLGKAIDNPGGFATVLLHRASVDIVRGQLHRPLAFGLLGSDEPADVDVEDGGFEADVVVADMVGGLRRALHGLTGPRRIAAALAYLVASFDQAPVGAACPQPVGGAGAQEAAEWAGLWYSGRRDCFPDGAAGEAAVRKRRSRAVAELHAALVEAAAGAGIEEADRG
jgi:DNA-directed RNA polymerase specialized sigma24 family protein